MSEPELCFEATVVEVKQEDGGQALIADAAPDPDDQECGPFVRIQSWCGCGWGREPEDRRGWHHPLWLKVLAGKRVRVTIEVLPGQGMSPDELRRAAEGLSHAEGGGL